MSTTTTTTTIAILSLGEMGTGIAKLLLAHGFPVLTSLQGRTEATRQRASSANIKLLETDVALVEQSDVLLSIVPPRDAFATAQRIVAAAKDAKRQQTQPLYFLDLNAVSPRSSRRTSEALEASPNIRFIDGGIIGGPPKPKDANSNEGEWSKPSIVVSGPHQLQDLPADGARLTEVLYIRHISQDIGTASGLKMCFASMTKGLTAIATQSFTSARALGVDSELKDLLENYSPKTGELATRGITACPPKAYRWIEEMRQIAETHRDEGGFEENGLFDEVAKVYEVMRDSELGRETTEGRKRGLTTEDVGDLMLEETRRGKKTKT